MSNVLHRTTKQYRLSTNTSRIDPVEWIINPDLKTPLIDAPFSELVTPYYKTHPDNIHLNIRCGPNAIERVEQDASNYRDYGSTPSLYLPKADEYKNYWWSVENLTIVLSWDYKDTDLQIEFANYLTHVCKSRCVFTLVNGVSTKFMDASKIKIINRIAA